MATTASTIEIIHREHQALAAVLHAFRAIVAGIRDGRFEADFKLLAAMIEYITEVPEKVHHPKEDHYLFAKLAERSPDARALIDELERQHCVGYEMTKELEHALVHYQGSGKAGFAQFDAVVARYLEFSWKHLNQEEGELMPLARKALSEEDWAEVDGAFSANYDPWSGPENEYANLFTKIVNMAPAPIGVGPSGQTS